MILKCTWKCKESGIEKSVLKKKKVGERLPDIKIYYKSTSIQENVLLALKQAYRLKEQNQGPETLIHTYGHFQQR